MRFDCRTIIDNDLKSASIEVVDGYIKDIRLIDSIDHPILLPGFIDIHTHGGDGVDVGHIKSEEDIMKLSSFYASSGVTSFLLSVMTDTKDKMLSTLSFLKEYINKPLSGAEFIGIHLEGPFLNSKYKGAMPEELILDANLELFNELNNACANNIKYITLAPEKPGMKAFIKALSDMGIVVSMGHSSATYEEALGAIDCGVKTSTHTFNAMKLFHMHEPAISGAALEDERVVCEVIADGFHLHKGTVRLIDRCKGRDGIIAISDSIEAAGLEDGIYYLGGSKVIVKDGDAKNESGVRAGSTLRLSRAFKNLIAYTGKPLDYISAWTSSNAARVLGLHDRGLIKINNRADFVLLDDNYDLISTYVKGNEVYRRSR